MLKPQDVMVLGWLALQRDKPWRYIDLAQELGLSASESHSAVARLAAARLVRPGQPGRAGYLRAGEPLVSSPQVNVKEALDFVIHGVPHAFYPERGPVGRGIPTGVAASPLKERFSLGEEIPVWPDAEGEARGYALKPLYKSAPVAARNNPKMYEYLALVDALRDGRVREKEAARKHLEKMFREE